MEKHLCLAPIMKKVNNGKGNMGKPEQEDRMEHWAVILSRNNFVTRKYAL